MEAIAPPKRARIPREATSDLRSGAKPPMQPTLIPTEEKLANPQRAKVAMSLPLSLSSWSYSFKTNFWPMSEPTICASAQGAPRHQAKGPKMRPKMP